MTIWVQQAQLALTNGVLVFFVSFLPMAIWQYRRYGRPSAARLVGSIALALYITALLTYTWLPLPIRETLDCSRAPTPRVDPFHFVHDIGDAMVREGLGAALRSFGFWQVLLNVVLFLPWGVIVRRFLHRGILVTTISGLAASLVIETAQLTGLFGIYPCAYRMFDVDDLILNTTGALVGALAAPLLLWWMPEARLLRARRTEARPVTMWRRWAGMALDAGLFFSLSTFLWILTISAAVAGGWDGVGDASALGWWGFFTATFIPWVALFVIPPWTGWAASMGQFIVWLTPVWREGDGVGHGTLVQRLARANVVAGPLLAASVIDEALSLDRWIYLIALLPLVGSLAMVPFTDTNRSLSGTLLGAQMRDIRTLPAPGPSTSGPHAKRPAPEGTGR